MMKGKGKNRGFGEEKNPPQQQMLYGKDESGSGNYWTWNDQILGPSLWIGIREYIPFWNRTHGSLEMALLCLDWR